MPHDTLVIRLSGKSQSTEIISGISIGGLFVHHPVCTCTEAHGAMWTVSHSASGMNLGATFTKRKDAMQFAKDMAATYDVTVGAHELIQQFYARGDKPSCADLADRNHAI
jgi:hypothetical protein